MWRTVLGGCLAALIVCPVPLTSRMSLAQPDLRRDAGSKERLRLRIASMNVSGRQIAASPPEALPQSSWRHTFGSERVAARTARQPVRFSADVVVLQGVTSLAPVRQMLPARKYHLVVSRQILQQADTVATPVEPVGTTALAIRRDSGLRVTAQDHLLGTAEPPAGAEMAAAATAVRLTGSGRTLWVMALDVAQGCAGETSPEDVAPCQAAKRQLDAIDAWLSDRLGAGETVILAGRFHRPFGTARLPGPLGKLIRFPSAGGIPGTCAADDGSMAATHVLATQRPHGHAETTLDGRLLPVDEAAPESGCLLMVDASL
ncbi:MAG: hypothetical protein KJZ80_00420 [Hyphomicrobiaceae bacterium]|nr:hypothetical protein [Hyphomicrobiaceae bacterium]